MYPEKYLTLKCFKTQADKQIHSHITHASLFASNDIGSYIARLHTRPSRGWRIFHPPCEQRDQLDNVKLTIAATDAYFDIAGWASRYILCNVSI